MTAVRTARGASSDDLYSAPHGRSFLKMLNYLSWNIFDETIESDSVLMMILKLDGIMSSVCVKRVTQLG